MEKIEWTDDLIDEVVAEANKKALKFIEYVNNGDLPPGVPEELGRSFRCSVIMTAARGFKRIFEDVLGHTIINERDLATGKKEWN